MDFLPLEMIEVLRESENFIVKQLFLNPLTKSGNLTISCDKNLSALTGKRKKWGAALISGDKNARKFNTEDFGEYSQTRRPRTASGTYRASSLDILNSFIDDSKIGNIKFVRCLKCVDPSGAHLDTEELMSQLKAMEVVETAMARQIGYSYRVSFKDFIDRYKFLAFDFDEPVDINRENCRLLLLRLKMEGWIIGKNKVFLRYYDEEYLSRLYETQVKKVVKIQAVMRKFLTKRKVIPRLQSQQSIGKD